MKTPAIQFTNRPLAHPIKLLIDYTTTSGHRFTSGSLHNVTPVHGLIALIDPRTGCSVAFGRGEWI